MGEETQRLPFVLTNTSSTFLVLNSLIDLNGTPIFEWHVVRCGSKMDTKKTCLEEIGLRVQN